MLLIGAAVGAAIATVVFVTLHRPAVRRAYQEGRVDQAALAWDRIAELERALDVARAAYADAASRVRQRDEGTATTSADLELDVDLTGIDILPPLDGTVFEEVDDAARWGKIAIAIDEALVGR